MPRKSVYSVGQTFGGLEILEVIPSNQSGRAVKLRCMCHYCGNETTQSGVHIKGHKSCGCQKNNSDTWSDKGPKRMPWQLPNGEAAKKNVLREYKRSAENRGLDFTLNEELFYDLVVGECVYCGDKLTNIKKGQGKTSGDFLFTGIDRKDNSIGYTPENSVSCCWKCNNMKWVHSEDVFLEHIKKIYERQRDKEEE